MGLGIGFSAEVVAHQLAGLCPISFVAQYALRQKSGLHRRDTPFATLIYGHCLCLFWYQVSPCPYYDSPRPLLPTETPQPMHIAAQTLKRAEIPERLGKAFSYCDDILQAICLYESWYFRRVPLSEVRYPITGACGAASLGKCPDSRGSGNVSICR